LESFNKICLYLFDKIYKDSQQIQALQKTRDNLLPKLMSGQIRVK